MTHTNQVRALLSDYQWHSHREGYRLGVMLHSRVSDLRRKGYVIECAKRDGGYWYRLLSKKEEGATLTGERPTASGSIDERGPRHQCADQAVPIGRPNEGLYTHLSQTDDELRPLLSKPGPQGPQQGEEAHEALANGAVTGNARTAAAADTPSLSPSAAAQPSLFELPEIPAWA